jgi:hypothetical protein
MANGNENTGLDKAKKIADILGSILLPVVLLVVGQWYTAQQAKSDSQKLAQEKDQENERADLDRVRAILDGFVSANSKQRIEAVNILYYFAKNCRLTEVLVPALQQGLNDDDEGVATAARGVLAYTANKCPQVIISITEASKTNPQTIDKVTRSDPKLGKLFDAVKLPKRVYIQIKNEDQRDLAKQIQTQLIAQGWVVPGIERVAVMPSQSQVRYFHDGENEAAIQLKDLVVKQGLSNVEVKSIHGYENSPKVNFNQFELWIAPS